METNHGKGPAVRKGIIHIKKIQPEPRQGHWLGYWDADLAIPLETILKMLEEPPAHEKKAIWSSRYKNFIHGSRSSIIRSMLGQIFSRLVRVYFNIELYDTQCGAKIFTEDCAYKVFDNEFLSRWFFDIELYYRCGPNSIKEFPVLYWENHTESKVSIIKDGITALFELPKIKRTYKKKELKD